MVHSSAVRHLLAIVTARYANDPLLRLYYPSASSAARLARPFAGGRLRAESDTSHSSNFLVLYTSSCSGTRERGENGRDGMDNVTEGGAQEIRRMSEDDNYQVSSPSAFFAVNMRVLFRSAHLRAHMV